MSDYEIEKQFKMRPIEEVASSIGIGKDSLYNYGNYIAKVDPAFVLNNSKPTGKLVFVTAITPTPLGEGKTTTTIGISDALNKIGYKSVAVIREPSLGPLFGVKGGATGGGKAQAVPMEDINTHFTGDIPAVEAAHNLLQTIIDNHIFHGNSLNIDPRRITMKRVMDANDRSLRDIIIGLGGVSNGIPRQTGFDITASSEVMAILGLSQDIIELKKRLSRMIIGYTYDKKPLTAGQLSAVGAMALILRNAIKPNLVQSLEGNPIFIHGGPFANIAHGSSSIISIKTALKAADFVVTEGGFGSDLGGEKFMDIVSRLGGFNPSVTVIVASARALKMHGGGDIKSLQSEDTLALKKGLENLAKHIENMQYFGVPVVVSLNKFSTDTESEISIVRDFVESRNVRFAVSEVWANGGNGGLELANKIVDALTDQTNFRFLYNQNEPVKTKIEKI
ncbi:MAG: formate--tetrahydrofolate ligase, partial [Caldisericaceae bacterium]